MIQKPSPCIVDWGTVISKEDMRRLLNDFSRVRYQHSIEGKLQSEGEGWVMEIFTDPVQSTLIANHTLYLNLQSFDYLNIGKTAEDEPYFDLVQDQRNLRIIPLSNPLKEQENAPTLDDATLEEMVTRVLSSKWDLSLDEDEEAF
jgi:hypothetical protein